jgi:hypothetical protein
MNRKLATKSIMIVLSIYGTIISFFIVATFSPMFAALIAFMASSMILFTSVYHLLKLNQEHKDAEKKFFSFMSENNES